MITGTLSGRAGRFRMLRMRPRFFDITVVAQVSRPAAWQASQPAEISLRPKTWRVVNLSAQFGRNTLLGGSAHPQVVDAELWPAYTLEPPARRSEPAKHSPRAGVLSGPEFRDPAE